MNSRSNYTAPLPLASPAQPLPESRGDRAVLRTMLAWFSALEAGEPCTVADLAAPAEHPGNNSPEQLDASAPDEIAATPATNAPTAQQRRRRGRPSSAVRLVWCALFSHADLHTGVAYPALPTVAELCALSLRCVRTSMRRLEALGLLKGQRRPGRATLYRLTLPTAATFPQRPARPLHLTQQPQPRTPAQNRARSPYPTPARHAATPATNAPPPRQQVPPEQLSEERNKEPLSAPAHATTPATIATVAPCIDPGTTSATASGCATAPPTAPAEAADARGRADRSSSPTARPARQARGAGAHPLAVALAHAWTPPGSPGTPATIALPALAGGSPPPDSEPLPHPGTMSPTPPAPPPPSLGTVMDRVRALNAAHAAGGGGRR